MGLSESLPFCLFAPCGYSLQSCANVLLVLHTLCAISGLLFVIMTVRHSNCSCGALERYYDVYRLKK